MIFLSFLPSHAFASSFVALLNMFLFFFFSVVFHIKFKKKNLKNKKNTKTMCVLCTLVLVYLG